MHEFQTLTFMSNIAWSWCTMTTDLQFQPKMSLLQHSSHVSRCHCDTALLLHRPFDVLTTQMNFGMMILIFNPTVCHCDTTLMCHNSLPCRQMEMHMCTDGPNLQKHHTSLEGILTKCLCSSPMVRAVPIHAMFGVRVRAKTDVTSFDQ